MESPAPRRKRPPETRARVRPPVVSRVQAAVAPEIREQRGRVRSIIQRTEEDREDPERYGRIHSSLFPPTGAGVERPEWTEQAAEAVEAEFRARLGREVPDPLMTAHLSEHSVDAWAVDAYARVRDAWPQIPRPRLTPAEVRDTVVGFAPGSAPDPILVDFVADRLAQWTSILTYETSVAQVDALIERLLRDAAVRRAVQGLAQGVAGATDYGPQTVYVNLAGEERSLDEMLRDMRTGNYRHHPTVGTLIHEFVHLNADSDYRRWVYSAGRAVETNEGFTEFLARPVMSAEERAGRGVHDARVTRIENDVARYVSVDDIARAYFAGEVWRLEGTSAVAEERFRADVGLGEEQPRDEEVAASREGPGIVSVVEPGSRYRFLNLGVNREEPKPQHVAYFAELFAGLENDEDARFRFVGHASDRGTARHNMALSERRAAAFYRMAREAGVPAARLVDADRPPHHGAERPTADNDTVRGRAFNRRVELFILRGGT